MSIQDYRKVTNDLANAIECLEYKKVENLLANLEVPVNLKDYCGCVPVKRMLDRADTKMAQLFINCPRIDWLAPTCDRNFKDLYAKYGVQYESYDEEKQAFDYFYYLPDKFAKKCPQEAEIIYEMIIAEVMKLVETTNYDELLFRTCNSLAAFKVALKYCTNIDAKNGEGESILHLTNNLEVAKLLLEMGLNINAKDKRGTTALADYCESKGKIRFLIEHGADTCALSNYGLSFLSSLDSLQKIQISEETFKSALKGCHFEMGLLSSIFNKYPSYKVIFESNLPLHLTALENPFQTKYFKKLSDEGIRVFLKHIVDKGFDLPTYFNDFPQNKRHLLAPFAADLMCLEARSGSEEEVKDFSKNFNPNLDKALCFANTSALSALIELGACASADFDGQKFFDLNPRLNEKTEFKSDLFLNLHKQGFDMFKPSPKTGKSFVQCLNPESTILVNFDSKLLRKYSYAYFDFLFPVGKLSPLFFNVLTKSEQDLFAPFDEDGNTILHYAKTSLNVPLADLKRVQNKTGKTPYDLTIESDPKFEAGALIYNEKDLRDYIEDYTSRYGDDIFRKRGGRLIIRAFNVGKGENLALANFLADEMSVSINRIVGDKTVGDCLDRYPSSTLIKFLLKHGHNISEETFEHIFVSPCIKGLKALLDDKSKAPYWIEKYFEEPIEYTQIEVFRTFINHKNGALGSSLVRCG